MSAEELRLHENLYQCSAFLRPIRIMNWRRSRPQHLSPVSHVHPVNQVPLNITDTLVDAVRVPPSPLWFPLALISFTRRLLADSAFISFTCLGTIKGSKSRVCINSIIISNASVYLFIKLIQYSAWWSALDQSSQ